MARKLGADRTVLCASPAYLARKGTPESPEDLVHHDCLLYSLLKEAAEWRFRAGKRSFGVPIEARFSAASGAVLRGAALAGMGLAVLPRFMIAADLDAGRLRPVIDSFEGVALGIYAVYPEPPAPGRAAVAQGARVRRSTGRPLPRSPDLDGPSLPNPPAMGSDGQARLRRRDTTRSSDSARCP